LHPDIRDLIEIVDYHTLIIEILAKTAQVQRYEAATLKVAIERDLRANVTLQHNNKTNEVEKVGSYLCSIFNLSDLNEGVGTSACRRFFRS